MGREKRAASSGLWPPVGTRVPPIKAPAAHPVERSQLTHGIQQHHRWPFTGDESAASDHRDVALPEELVDLTDALGMAGGQDEQSALATTKPGEGIQDLLLFATHGRAGDQDRSAARQLAELGFELR